MILDKETIIALTWFLGLESIVFLYFWWKREARITPLDFIMFGSLPNTVLLSLGLLFAGSDGLAWKGINLAVFGAAGLVGFSTLLFVIHIERNVLSQYLLPESKTISTEKSRQIILFAGRAILLFSIFSPSVYYTLASSNWLVRLIAMFTITGHYIMFKRCWR
ncbi:MAG: hypothetical protein ABIH88_01765 [Patescibacteria group bacterium]|nr:hypothetical protein [Patescibacteria group bacterium]